FQREAGVHAIDVAKRLIDLGHHPPTIYFPLVVPEALMMEPTETETRETLDSFVEDMLRIADECDQTPELVKQAPTTTPVSRLDEGRAVKQPVLRFRAE
ncbi:MAG: aminomethyl-transferring glycine dehydrogenase subunit GcvPB, partial [Planctomycetota bacterium]|nr:aminomethyl-transferring glycine dehydrogenase subunit GcvPB [Planctomycetota bacterium]